MMQSNPKMGLIGSGIYDSRTSRCLSLDPLQKKYPGETNNGLVSQNPILFADKDALAKKYRRFVPGIGLKLIFHS